MNSVAPRWSLDTIYPGPTSREFTKDIAELKRAITEAESAIEDTSLLERDSLQWLRTALPLYNRCTDLFENLESYSYSIYSVDTSDRQAQNAITTVGTLSVPLSGLAVKFREALSAVNCDLESLPEFEDSADPTDLSKYRYVLREERFFQSRQLSVAEEGLAADLARSGADAWSRLQETLSSSLTVDWDNETSKTVVELRNLAFHHDRSIRRKAWQLELEAWRTVETPMAFALNGVKGATVVMNQRRGWDSTLERSIRQNRLSRKALDILIGEMERSLPLFRRYLTAKAKILNLPRLSFYDIFASVGDNITSWTFDEAIQFISKKLGNFDPQIGNFVQTASERMWIDAQPRSGKVGGAYCIDFPIAGESRILTNFDGSYDGVSTLAHELGHAWHSELLRDFPALQRRYPMTLAETASIFNETFVFYQTLDEVAGTDQELYVLEQYLQGACQVIIDILSRFYFESDVMEQRADRELSADEFCTLMTTAQKKTYGDAMNFDELHPYMWAVKGHYYRADLAFYNFPYAFGQLFGLGLYNQYERDGIDFASRYRSLLLETGRESAVAVAAAAGFDIESPDFWRGSLERVAGLVTRFEKLVR